MTSNTRYFLVGGTAVLVVGLAAGLVTYSVGVPTLGALAGEPAELVYVPEEATIVAFADVRRVMDSQLRRELREAMPEGADAAEAEGRQQFLDTTGIDLERDVEYVLAYLLPDGPAAGEAAADDTANRADQGLALVRGRFDQGRIEELIEAHGGVAESYSGKRLLIRPFDAPAGADSPLQNPDSEFALGFIQAGLVAVGTSAAIRRAIDLESGTGIDVTRNETLMELIRDSQDADVWAIGQFDRLLDRARLPSEVTNQLPPITNFAASGRIDSGLAARVRTDARDEESAQQLSDVVRGFVALAKMQSASQPQLETLLQSLQLSVDGTSVVLEFAIPDGTLRSLLPQPSSDTDPAQ